MLLSAAAFVMAYGYAQTDWHVLSLYSTNSFVIVKRLVLFNLLYEFVGWLTFFISYIN